DALRLDRRARAATLGGIQRIARAQRGHGRLGIVVAQARLQDARMKRILVPLPDRDFDVTEVAVPWKILRRAGHEVVFATEAGAVAACDPLLLPPVGFCMLGAAA